VYLFVGGDIYKIKFVSETTEFEQYPIAQPKQYWDTKNL
jgi:hypothetical protein